MKLGAVVLGAVVTVLALAGVGALYALGGGGGAEAQYRTTLSLLREIQQLSSKWSIETARVKSDPLADFDSLGFFVPRMNRLKQNLAASVRQIPDLPDRLAGDLAAYSNAVAAKEERIERFKAEYAVVRASTNYFPLAATNLVQQAEGAAVDGLAQAVSAIASDMSTYLMSPSDAGRSRLAAGLQALRAASGKYPLPVASAVMDFLSHGETLLDRKEPAEELFREATSNDLSEATNRIAARLEAELNRREVAAAYYQRAMAAVVGVLALFWVVLVWRRRSRGGPPALDEAFQSPEEPAPTPEAAVDSAVRFGSSLEPQAPAVVDPPDPVLAIGRDAPAGEAGAEAEAEAEAGAEAFVEGDPPAAADAAAGEARPGGREERPAGEDDAPVEGEAPAVADADADAGEEAVSTGDGAPFGEGGEDDPSARPEASSGSSASVPAEDDLQAIRDLLLRIDDPAPAAAEREPPAGGEVTAAGEEAPVGGEAEAAAPADGEEVLPSGFGSEAGPVEPISEAWPPISGEVVTVGEEAPAGGEVEAAPVADGEETLPSGSGSLSGPAEPVGEEWPPVGGEAVTVGEETPAGGEAEDTPPAAGEELPLPAPEGWPASVMRPASPAESLPETRRRVREALGAGAAVVDLRAGGAGPASAAAPDVRRNLRRIEDLLERVTPSPSPSIGDADEGGVDVNACIDEVVRATGAESAVTVERDLRPVPGASGSKAGVRLLLAEIVENAALAVPSRPERPPSLRVHTSRRGGEVLVTVVDNGVGIPEEAREAVFLPFHTSRDGALGVGLTLARRLAEREGGTVSINSLPGHGTVARIALPVARPVS